MRECLWIYRRNTGIEMACSSLCSWLPTGSKSTVVLLSSSRTSSPTGCPVPRRHEAPTMKLETPPPQPEAPPPRGSSPRWTKHHRTGCVHSTAGPGPLTPATSRARPRRALTGNKKQQYILSFVGSSKQPRPSQLGQPGLTPQGGAQVGGHWRGCFQSPAGQGLARRSPSGASLLT